MTALENMRCNLRESIVRRARAESELADLNRELEARVSQRTRELEQSNETLNRTLERLRATQAQLIESEKMAAIGGLVAGVAHEISTPLGIGYTAASYLEQEAQKHAAMADGGDGARDFTANALESSQLIRQNLERAAQLIRAFKQVSVDQSSEERRPFNLHQYLEEILLSLRPRLRQQAPEISILCPSDLTLNSYPGAFYQIMTNLVLNSLIHGFDSRPDGRIRIEVSPAPDALLLRYSDNGSGIAAEVRHRLFQPFVTTRRHQGCSGLGMHIVYNLVTQLLHGSIRCRTDWPEGACFEIEIPLHET
ncbi:sensor histidine kinase [Marinobacterium aestuariivivens]|uniref:histidine kinase n=1 Tax=Marinobacterium aestuariivivens TaxID=1698799 RepID=A0ABW2A5F2_9GAMM